MYLHIHAVSLQCLKQRSCSALLRAQILVLKDFLEGFEKQFREHFYDSPPQMAQEIILELPIFAFIVLQDT